MPEKHAKIEKCPHCDKDISWIQWGGSQKYKDLNREIAIDPYQVSVLIPYRNKEGGYMKRGFTIHYCEVENACFLIRNMKGEIKDA